MQRVSDSTGAGLAVLSEFPSAVQGYLAHKKQHPPRTLHQDYAWVPMVVLGRGAVS